MQTTQGDVTQKLADHPSLKVAIRQPLLDYGTTVGLKTLKQHVEKIVVPDVTKEIDIPVIGKIKIEVTSLKCVDFQEPRELTEIQIDDDSFHAKAQEVSATFVFHWHWETKSLPISGGGGVFRFFCVPLCSTADAWLRRNLYRGDCCGLLTPVQFAAHARSLAPLNKIPQQLGPTAFHT